MRVKIGRLIFISTMQLAAIFWNGRVLVNCNQMKTELCLLTWNTKITHLVTRLTCHLLVTSHQKKTILNQARGGRGGGRREDNKSECCGLTGCWTAGLVSGVTCYDLSAPNQPEFSRISLQRSTLESEMATSLQRIALLIQTYKEGSVTKVLQFFHPIRP